MNKNLFKTFMFLFCYFFSCQCDQLTMIQQTFRHGARYPVFFEKADGSDIAVKTNNQGELTKQGKNMHYLLGKMIYKQYWSALFSGTPYENKYNQTLFYIKSTDFNRTLQSVQSHLFGLLQNLPKLSLNKSNYDYSLPAWKDFQRNTNISDIWYIFQKDVIFHPTPIHTQKRGASQCDDGDFLTKYDLESCPNQKFWIGENKNNDFILSVQKDPRVKQAIKALSNTVGQQIDFQDVYKWKDSEIALRYLNLPTLQIFQEPRYSRYYSFMYMFTMYNDLYAQIDQIRTVSSLYLKQTLNNLLGSKNGTFTPKIVIYSSHDTTIGMILTALGYVTPNCIVDHYLNGVQNNDTCIWQQLPYTANVIFELWKKQNEQFYIKIRYNGKLMKIPICESKTQCPLNQFQEWVQEFTIEDVHKACGYFGESKAFYAVVFLLSSCILALLFYIFYLSSRIKKINSQGKSSADVQNYQDKNSEREKKKQVQFELK